MLDVQSELNYSTFTKKKPGIVIIQMRLSMRVKFSFGYKELFSEFPKERHINVGQMLQSITDSHPEIYQQWCNKGGHLRTSFPIFVNGVNIRYLKGMEAELTEGDEVYVIPMLAGG